MQNKAGFDLGTNSIGWAIVNEKDPLHILDAGVTIFPEGVKIEKGVESSRAAERTMYRSTRRRIARRRKRKQDTLAVLIANNMCPLSAEALQAWKKDKKQFPMEPEFLAWLASENAAPHTGQATPESNPYFLRSLAMQKVLTPHQQGRVFYHLAQRRGFLSSRIERVEEETDTKSTAAQDKDAGVVKESIKKLTEQLAGDTLGQFFYKEMRAGAKVRGRYVGRKEHYFKEFYAICEKQQLGEALTAQLFRAIFFVRPLKSQKGLVGKCPFEKNKPRCPISHPDFEKFRMYQFINSIRIIREDDTREPLTPQQINTIVPLFLRKSKPTFLFAEIQKKLTTKTEKPVLNYKDYYPVSGCPTIARLVQVFGEDWEAGIMEKYTARTNKNGEKTPRQMVDDVWHALFSFDEDALLRWSETHCNFTAEERTLFNKIVLKQGYAGLSLLAIRKILPYLQAGYLYSHAAFLANLPKVAAGLPEENIREMAAAIGTEISDYTTNKKLTLAANECIAAHLESNRQENPVPFVMPANTELQNKLQIIFGKDRFTSLETGKQQELITACRVMLEPSVGKQKPEYLKLYRLDEQINNLLEKKYRISSERLKLLYHPSDLDSSFKEQISPDGIRLLGSPFTPSVRNPVVMRALHQLRKLVNHLLTTGAITPETPIHLEMARELNDANRRRAIERFQREREKKRTEYKARITELFSEATGKVIEPNDDDILRYELWEEQNHVCLYTGREIGITQFIGGSPEFDFEHTIPRSISYDNSMENLTLCDQYFNRSTKKNRAPAELPNHKEILARLKSWELKVEEYDKLISKTKSGSMSETKEAKDARIAKRHYLQMHKNYWQTKLDRFKKTDFTYGFKNSQLVDTGIITRLAHQYLKTIFSDVSVVKGTATAKFREVWGIQKEYEKKSRDKHTHHAIDAVVIACMSRDKYSLLAQLYRAEEENNTAEIHNTYAALKPWSGFTEDLKELENKLLVAHRRPDNTLKKARKKIRHRGKVVLDANGKPRYKTGDTARGALHKQTFYGAIQRKDENGVIEQRYVIRTDVASLTKDDVEAIVDPAVREKIRQAIETRGIKDAFTEPVWMNEEKKIPIKKVRLLTRIKNPLPIKQQFNKSKAEYKRMYYAENDANYLMVLYEGKNHKGALVRDFELISRLDAINARNSGEALFPATITRTERKNSYILPVLKRNNKVVALRSGVLCILCSTPEMLIDRDNEHDILKRLFIVTGLSSDKGTALISLRHHQEARPSSQLGNPKKGLFNTDDEYTNRWLTQNNFFGYIEGIDFIMNPDGKIFFY